MTGRLLPTHNVAAVPRKYARDRSHVPVAFDVGAIPTSHYRGIAACSAASLGLGRSPALRNPPMKKTDRSTAFTVASATPHIEKLHHAGFAVRHTVAAGRFGVVYRALDLVNHRDVAIKVIDLEALRPTQGPHSETEIEALAALRHPHVVPLFSSGRLDDAVRYFVMPWIEGASLRGRLRERGRLPLVDALRLGVGVADALVALHSRRLIHRDVKPENVLIEGRHAVLIDFGLVCTAHDASTVAQEQDPVVGTPVYMAPEQWQHGAAIDGRADIFGLASMIYESLTGIAPNDEVQIERRVRSLWRWSESQPSEALLNGEHPPVRPTVRLRARRKDAPDLLEQILRRALRLDPDARPATAVDFRDALECILAEQLAASGPPRWLRKQV